MNFIRHTRNRVAVIFDIGSGSVGAALSIIEPDKTPTMLYTTRVLMVFKSRPQFEELVSEMLKALRKSAEKLARYAAAHLEKETGEKRLHEVHCIFSSSWHTAKTHSIISKNKQPFLITERFVERLLADALDEFRLEIKSTGGSALKDLTVLENKVIQTTLNGYPTSQPYGKRVVRAELALYTSLISSAVEDCVFDVVEEMLGVEKKISHTLLLAFFIGVRDIFHTEGDFLLVDLGGEITNFGLVRANILVDSTTFPWGRNTVLRKVASRLGTIPEEAHSLIRMWGAGELASGDHGGTTKALAETEKEWLDILKNTYDKLAKGERLPKRIFLIALPDTEKWFTSILERNECSSYTFTQEPFQVEVLSGKNLTGSFTLRKGAVYDPYLGIESIFVNRVVGL